MQVKTKTTLTEEELVFIENKLAKKGFSNLEHFFSVAKINYNNLHEFLGLTPTYLTQLKKNPVKKGTIEIAKEITKRTGIRASILIKSFRFGYDNITMSEMEDLQKEEEHCKD